MDLFWFTNMTKNIVLTNVLISYKLESYFEQVVNVTQSTLGFIVFTVHSVFVMTLSSIQVSVALHQYTMF